MINKNKGITLIALIITIVVLIILAGAALNIALGENGIFTKSKLAADTYTNAAANEAVELRKAENVIDDLTGNGGGSSSEPTISENTIPKETTGNGYIGYYADVDGNGSIDGVIYVDLLVKKPTEGVFSQASEAYEEGGGEYTLPTDVTTSNVKDYVVSETAVTDSRFDSTARYIISPASSTSGTKNRFYVMGLEDITDGTNNTFYWYSSAYDVMTDYETTTSEDFGTGKTNTTAMLAKWDGELYGTQNDSDLWKWIKVKTGEENEGWFVPSRAEWTAFGDAFSIHSNIYDQNWNVTESPNYTNYKLSEIYWSSSQSGKRSAYVADNNEAYISYARTSNSNSVRLSTTF